MTRTLFSIITPTYNSGPKLEKTIESVLSQDSSLFEYLVMDGGSADGTRGLLEKYHPSLHWFSAKDAGVYDAMNKGIAHASSQYVYFLGAGDCLRPGILKKLAAGMPRDTPTLVYGNVYEQTLRRVFNGRYSRWKLSRINICHQAIFYQRQIFDMIGLFDLRYPIMADYVFNMKCFGNPGIEKNYIPDIIADFEGGGLSITHTDTQYLQDRLELFRDNLGPLVYGVNKAISLIPAGIKEARYEWYCRLKASLGKKRG